MFEAHGTVESAQVIMDRDTGRSKGFGFVEMKTDQEAQAAIAALNGKEFERPRPDRQRGPAQAKAAAVAAAAAAAVAVVAATAAAAAAVGAMNATKPAVQAQETFGQPGQWYRGVSHAFPSGASVSKTPTSVPSLTGKLKEKACLSGCASMTANRLVRLCAASKSCSNGAVSPRNCATQALRETLRGPPPRQVAQAQRHPQGQDPGRPQRLGLIRAARPGPRPHGPFRPASSSRLQGNNLHDRESEIPNRVRRPGPAGNAADWARPTPPWTTEERLQRIEAMGQRIQGYIQFMAKVANMNGTSAEAKDLGLLSPFTSGWSDWGKQLDWIQEELKLGIRNAPGLK